MKHSDSLHRVCFIHLYIAICVASRILSLIAWAIVKRWKEFGIKHVRICKTHSFSHWTRWIQTYSNDSGSHFCGNCFESCLVLHGDWKNTRGLWKKSGSHMLVTWNLRRYGNGHQPTVQADPVAWRFHQARLPSFERIPIHLRRDLLSRLGEGWKGTSWENHKIALQPYYNRSQVLRRCSLSLIENFGPLLQKLSKNRQRNWFYPTCQARVSRF